MVAGCKLQVLISTHQAAGLDRVAAMVLPQLDGVGYIVSCQSPELPVPQALQRPDIELHFTSTKGISANRNHSIALATAPYALIADDDLVLHADSLPRIIDALDQNPDIDIACFRIDTMPPKVYPPSQHDIFKPFKNYNISSVEIAMRVASVRASGIRFDERMGIGTDRLTAGEEEMWLLDAKAAGLKGRFFPVTIAAHRHESTGVRLQSAPGVLRAQGVVMRRKYPLTAIPRLILKAYRTKGPFLRNLRYLMGG